MATLVLTAAGTALGGPIGGAIGALVGQSIDRTLLFPAKRRDGPRLDELRLQLSSYGTDVPRLFGTMRVAGTVIWATDLIESRSTSHAGKGQLSITSYSYSASFAVLLSARPVLSVGRIWAEGKLLRGAAGDWKASTAFRLHSGGEDQPVDPLIASAVGTEAAPAHRGCAYAVFEGLQLADYGNRIPSLTFEVIADAGPVSVGAIAAAVAMEATGDTGQELGGFAAAGTARGVLDQLAEAGGGWFAVEGARAVLRGGRAGDTVMVADTGVGADGASGARRSRSTAAIERVPRTLAVSHYDPARDYQAGVQRARRPGAGAREERVELPAVLAAGDAKAMATAMLARAEAERVRRVIALGLEGLAIGPGERVAVEGEAGLWRVAEVASEALVTRLTLVPIAGAAVAMAGADPGRALRAADEPIGATMLIAAELPGLGDAPLLQPRLTVVAAGTGAGWRPVPLLYSLDAGGSWLAAGVSAPPGVMGTLVEGPGPGSACLVDREAGLVVALAEAGMFLAEADDRGLDAGANLALVGDELLQFGRAEPIGAGRWRLSRLWRGRRGTEAAIGGQAPGDRFVLLDSGAACVIDLPLSALGTEVRLMASGVGDGDVPATARATLSGASVRPPAPTGLRVDAAEGGHVLRWRRRSRAGWRWPDGGDVPLGEETERYRVTLTRVDGSVREVSVAEPALAIDPAEWAGGPLTVTVRQNGTLAESESASIVIGGEQA